MISTRYNKSNIALIGPPLTVVALTLDTKFGWNLGDAFWGAVIGIVIWLGTAVTRNKLTLESEDDPDATKNPSTPKQ